MGMFPDAQGQLTPQCLIRSGRISNSSKILLIFSLPASMKKIRSKMKALEWTQHFPHYNPMGAICCHGNQSSNPTRSKTKCNQSPTPMMLQIKFGYDWPTGCGDIRVWKCLPTYARTHGRSNGRTNGRRIDRYTISSI